MATLKTIGFDEYVDGLENIYEQSEKTVGKMIYEGAGTVADAVRASIASIPSREIYETSGGSRHQRGITDVERKGLSDTLGISRVRNDNGFINVRIGFDGYNDHVTANYPKGHPNSMVARSIESGTSWLDKTPFIAPAVAASRNKAEQVMEEIFDNSNKGNVWGRYRK